MFLCVICKQKFPDSVAAKQSACSGGGHVLQEIIDGSRQVDDDGNDLGPADFYAAGPDELKRWGQLAKEKFGWNPDE
jgi:hypothetical protein